MDSYHDLRPFATDVPIPPERSPLERRHRIKRPDLLLAALKQLLTGLSPTDIGPDEVRALECAGRAGRSAHEHFDPHAAVWWYSRALELHARAPVDDDRRCELLIGLEGEFWTPRDAWDFRVTPRPDGACDLITWVDGRSVVLHLDVDEALALAAQLLDGGPQAEAA